MKNKGKEEGKRMDSRLRGNDGKGGDERSPQEIDTNTREIMYLLEKELAEVKKLGPQPRTSRTLKRRGKIIMASKKNKDQALLPAAQAELNQKVQRCTRSAYHAEAFAVMELIARGMKLQAIRAVAENAEVLDYMGFKRLEDFFASLGISRSTGFDLKKIAEAFSEEEVRLLYSMGFSQRALLKLASLPPGQLPTLEDIDPTEFKSIYKDALADIEKQKKDIDLKIDRATRDLVRQKKDLEAQVDRFQRKHPEDIGTWVKGMRPFLAEAWEDFLAKWRDFVMNENSQFNDEAQDFMVEFYDRIFADLDSIDETRYEKTGNRYGRRRK